MFELPSGRVIVLAVLFAAVWWPVSTRWPTIATAIAVAGFLVVAAVGILGRRPIRRRVVATQATRVGRRRPVDAERSVR